MRYGQIRKFDVANGPGIRSTLFVTGCPLNCPGCFNQEYRQFNAGKKWTKSAENELMNFLKNEHVSGLSILGGEPLAQDHELDNLLKRVKTETKKDIWMWTGFCFEQLNQKQLNTLQFVDVLVDGPFEQNKKNLKLKFKGSDNQRIIDLKKTRLCNNLNEIVLLNDF